MQIGEHSPWCRVNWGDPREADCVRTPMSKTRVYVKMINVVSLIRGKISNSQIVLQTWNEILVSQDVKWKQIRNSVKHR